MISNSLIKSTDFSSGTKPSSLLKRIKVSSSVIEPSEIGRNWTNSFLPFRAAPYAIFTGMETAACAFVKQDQTFLPKENLR